MNLPLGGHRTEGVAVIGPTTGGRLITVAVAAAELLSVVRSRTVVVALAALVRAVPSGIAQLVAATSVRLAVAPPRITGRFTVSSLALPVQALPSLTEHETRVAAAGKTSFTTTLRAGGRPRLIRSI